jgi:hypothetical protein
MATITEHEHEKIPVILIETVEVDGENIPVMVEKSIAPPRDDEEEFVDWAQREAEAAILASDDRVTKRWTVWPDKSSRPVYRCWHQDGRVTVWSTPAPKPPMIP